MASDMHYARRLCIQLAIISSPNQPYKALTVCVRIPRGLKLRTFAHPTSDIIY